jgi:broad specificity phosphatase PhoE
MPVDDRALAEAGSLSESAFAVADAHSVHPAAPPDGAELWLIRHGETAWSKSGQHTGRTDVELTDEGRAQARALAPMFAQLRPALVLSSPRRRARETAALAGLRVDDVDPDLAEWDYGDYEGRTTADIRRDVPGWTLWTHGVPRGETAAQVAQRADRVIDRARAALPSGPVVLIAHGHISRVLGARWIGLPPTAGGNLALGTAAPSLLGAQHGLPVIDRWNLPNHYQADQPQADQPQADQPQADQHQAEQHQADQHQADQHQAHQHSANGGLQ